jgi:hypothetical protein
MPNPHASRENLIKQAAEAGWSFLDGPAPQGDEEKPEPPSRIAQIASQLEASDPRFCELLDYLADETFRRVNFIVGGNLSAEQIALWGAFREGQNALAFGLFKLIAQGRKQELKGRER